ncbi:MAG TPA: hypothetical protein VH594_08555 [Trebonia sp.]|jgi:hypothetical protein
MSDLKEELDRALRTVTFAEAPVERAKRAGRRIRARRRVALLAGVLAVAAVAAGYPALAGSAAAPPAPLTGHRAATPSPGRSDMTVTAYPAPATTQAPGGLASKTGEIAAGSVGDMKWRISVVPPGQKNPVPADSCYTITIVIGGDVQGPCYDLQAALGRGLGAAKPAAFTEFLNDGVNATTVGEAAADVTYFIVDFTDGQQLKLLPVTVAGHRYIAWMAPLSMRIDSVVAHLGGPYSDSGQTATAVPFEQPGGPPVFGLWQRAGQAAPPRDTQVIGAGETDGHAWKVTAYEGPWGTCFVTNPVGSRCVESAKLDSTAILVWGDASPMEQGFGSAAPGVATVRIALSNGKKVTAQPVGVGNQDLFAFPTGKGVTPTGWTAFDASGHQVGAGSVAG